MLPNILYLLQVVYEAGIARKWSLLVISALWLIGFINTFLLLPAYKVSIESTQVKSRTKVINTQNLPMVNM